MKSWRTKPLRRMARIYSSGDVQQEVRMAPAIAVDEVCLTVADVAKRLKVDDDTVRRLFIDEPGVIVISFHQGVGGPIELYESPKASICAS